MTDKTASPKGGAVGRSNGKVSKLPRLGSGEKKPLRIKEVEIPEQGVSVVLAQPSVETMIELQEADVDEDNVRETFKYSAKLVAQMLVEPDWDEDKVCEEVKDWSMNDWSALQTAALGLSGIGGQVQRAALTDFPGQDN